MLYSSTHACGPATQKIPIAFPSNSKVKLAFALSASNIGTCTKPSRVFAFIAGTQSSTSFQQCKCLAERISISFPLSYK